MALTVDNANANANAPWPTTTLGELFNIGAGKSVTPAARNGESMFPFLRTSNVLWGRIDTTDVDTMAFSPEEIEAKSLKAGDLLVCEGGDIGRSAIWNGELEACAFQNHLHRLRPKQDDVVPRFFMYYLQAGFTLLNLYEGAGNKTTIPNLSRSRLAALKVPAPPKPEQQKIAAVMWKLQRAIAIQDRLIAAAGDLKQSAMQRLFTHGLRGEPLKDTEIGPMPSSWSASTLGELTSTADGVIQTGPFGSQLHAREYQPDGVPVVNPTHLLGNKINHESVPKISTERAAELAKHALQRGDILFARRGQIGRHGYVGNQEAGWICGTGCFLVRVRHPAIDNEFLPCFLSVPGVVEWLEANAAGAIMPNLNNTVLGNLPVYYPASKNEQRDIAAALATIDRKLAHHRAKRAALDALFQTTLHQLMTAQVRVADLDIDTSEVTDHFPDAGNMIEGPAGSAPSDHFADANKMIGFERPAHRNSGA